MSLYDYTFSDQNKEYAKLIDISYKNATKEQALKVSKALKKLTVSYDSGKPEVSDETWDDLYFWLKEWQDHHNGIINDACSDIIYFKTVSKLEKVEHNHPMLSLNKTKDLSDIIEFSKNQETIAMLKMDGLTCSLYYEDGRLVRAETRGNGLIGEDVTHNAYFVKTIPQTIPYAGKLIVDGEIICKYTDFQPFIREYKNPRNFAAGSIRLLNSKESYNRHLTFVAWDLIGQPDINLILDIPEEKHFFDFVDNKLKTLDNKLMFLAALGFKIVPCQPVDTDISEESLQILVDRLRDIALEWSYPIDGLVFKYNDCEFYESLGSTAHHFRGGLAYKFYDELYNTKLLDIEWTMGRAGVLTPVAVFDEVDTGDSIVTRANLHNISIMNEIYPHQWCTGMNLEIYLANMIIPQVKSATVPEAPSYRLDPPKTCPICGAATEIRQINDSKELICTNPECQGKLINRLDHFCSKKGLDIKGLSKATLEKLTDLGWIENFSDLFNLREMQQVWSKMPGFGEKSVENILNAIDQAKNCTLEAFIAAIGIPLIGNNVAKEIIKHVCTYDELRDMITNKYPFWEWNGFAEAKCESLWNFDYTEADDVYHYLNIKPVELEESGAELEGKTFVITGRLKTVKNRDELISLIRTNGGKVSNSISGNTAYLINNDINSTSGKNKAAKERGIPIITEEQFMQMI